MKAKELHFFTCTIHRITDLSHVIHVKYGNNTIYILPWHPFMQRLYSLVAAHEGKFLISRADTQTSFLLTLL